MDIEDHDGADASANDDLRSVLESAVRETSARDETHPAHAEAPAGEQPAVERTRDQQGRFAQKPAEQPAPVATNTAAQPAAPDGTALAATPKAPLGWAAEDFAALTPAHQDRILKRETDIAKALEERAPKVRAADEFERIATPFRETFSRLGLTAHQATERLFAVERELQRDPAGTILKIAQAYGVQLPGIPPQQAVQGRPQAPQPAGPPVEHIVRQQVQSELQRQSLQGELDAFARDPANKHFNTLKPAMHLMLSSGRAQSLREAYDQAAWLDPSTREQLLAERAAPAAAQAQAAADQERVARARSAASSVRGAPAGASAPVPNSKGSLRDDLVAAVQQHRR